MLLLIPVLLGLFLPQAPSTATAGSVQVDLTIDFGKLTEPALRQRVTLPVGATVVDATRAVAAVEQDWLCCSREDVWSIAGVEPDSRTDRCWMWRLGDRLGPELPARYRVAEGDVITWVYTDGQPPQLTARAVSLLPAATEIAFAVGGESALVGLSHLCTQPPGRELPRVMSTTVDSERWSMGQIDRFLRDAGARREPLYRLDEARIRELAPTVVFSQGLCPVCAATPEQAQQAIGSDAAACARLHVLSPRSLADVAANIREVGEAHGRVGAGRIAARAFERRLEVVAAQPRLAAPPRVLILEWFEPLWVSGEWIAEMVVIAGGEPLLVGASSPSRRVEWSDVVAADADLIVHAACSMTIERTQRELAALRAVPEWSGLRAVRTSRVFVVDGQHHFSTPGPGLAVGAQVIRDLLVDPGGNGVAGSWLRVAPE